MPTRLYYDDSYTVQFTARILERLEANERPAVVLDGTYFYPTGGGQPNDTGTINGVEVVDVFTRETDLAVVHVLKSALPDTDEQAECRIDWSRRFDYMQQHTGQHILTQAFIQTAGINTVGFHLGVESVTIDLDRLNIPAESVEQAETLANRIVAENRPVTARIVDPAEVGADIRKRGTPDKIATEGLRVVTIENFDRTACGGTHVAHTGEIGVIKVLRLDKRSDKTRVEFRCGGRALADYRLKNDLANRLTAALNCGLPEVDQAITRQQEQIKDLQRTLKETKSRLLEYDARALAEQAVNHNGLRIVKLVTSEYDVDDLRLLAKRITEQPGMVAIMAVPGEKANLLIARSADLPHDLNPVFKRAVAVIGGRGGGKPDFVQGGGVPAAAEQLSAALDEAEKALVGS